MDNYPPKQAKNATDIALRTLANEPTDTDPFGMYTGITKDGEPPIQDQDDL